MQLQHLHLWPQPMDTMYLLTIWYIELLWNTKISPKYWDDCPRKFHEIKPMVISYPLDESYPQNCSETLNCKQNLEIIALKICKGLTQFSLVPLWPTLIPTTILKQQTVTKTLRWLSLFFWKGLTQWALGPLWPTIKPFFLKHQTVTKNLRWLPWIQSINWWWQV